ncbi:MAG: GIN domain-containing protein, partial [Bacteroidia bacterium]
CLAASAQSQTLQKRSVGTFDKIDASGAANVYFTSSDSTGISISGNSAEFNFVETKVQDGILFIKTKGNIHAPLKIEVSAPTLNLITLSGASHFETRNELKADSIHIEASGASDVDAMLGTRAIRTTISGASEVTLNGTTQNFYANASGASTLKAYKLNSVNTWATASGASTAKVFASQKISANATGASTIKFKGEPKDVIAEGSSSSQIMKIGADENSSVKKNSRDSSSTSFNLGNKKIIIADDGDTIHKPSHDDFKYWSGFFMGSTGYMNSRQGFTVNKPYNYMELDYSKCFNFQLNLFQSNIHLYKNYINLVTGLGFTFNQYQFENKVKLNADSSFTWGKVDSSNTYTYKKDRLKTAYINVPLLLDFNTNANRRKSVHISIGVVGGYLIGARTKEVLVKDGVKSKYTRNDNYNLAPLTANAYASIGYKWITVYAEYQLNQMFKNGHGPELYPFSVGIRLVRFGDYNL